MRTEEVTKISGIDNRQIRYWTDLGLVEPYLKSSGKGVNSCFNTENLVHIYIIRELIESGLNTKTINLIMQKVRHCAFDKLSDKSIATNGKDLIEVTNEISFQKISHINPLYIMRIRPLFHKALRDMELFTNQTNDKETHHGFNRN